MHVVVVVPCLNEEGSVCEASRSLGFGAPQTPRNVTLVLVDNGSTDNTADEMANVAAACRPDSVVLVREPERGYVLARNRGAIEARRLARRLGLREEEVLLVQADADTKYSPGYVEALAEAALSAGSGALIEGVSEAPEPPDGCEAYYRLEREIDAATEPAFGDMAEDVVVDDKVAAFWLSDYFGWGGHRREYGHDGYEVLAETTRLCIRAKLRNGFRVRAERAVAVTSQRRTFQNPALAFATAGYPRDAGWVSGFRACRASGLGMASFSKAANAPLLRELSQMRTHHLLGMFSLLPTWFSALSGRPVAGRPGMDAVYTALLRDAPVRELVADQPGQLIQWALDRPTRDLSDLLSSAGVPGFTAL